MRSLARHGAIMGRCEEQVWRRGESRHLRGKNQNPTGTGLNFFEAASFKHSTSTVLSIEGASCNHSIAALFSVLTIQRRLKNSQVQLCFIQGKDAILNQFIAHRNETYSDLFISHLTLEDTTLTEPQKKQEF